MNELTSEREHTDYRSLKLVANPFDMPELVDSSARAHQSLASAEEATSPIEVENTACNRPAAAQSESSNSRRKSTELKPDQTSEMINLARSNRHGKLTYAQILADPNVPERTWMAACIAAGENFAPHKRSMSSCAWSGFTAGVGVSFAVLTATVAYISGLFTAANWNVVMLGSTNLDKFLTEMAGADALGCVVAILSTLLFWSGMLLQTLWFRRLTNGLLLGMLALASFTFAAINLGNISAPLIVGASLLGGILSMTFGNLCRETLPKSATGASLARANIKWLILPALFMASILVNVPGQLGAPDRSYSTPDGLHMTFSILAYAFCLAAPGLAMARAAKSQSWSASALIALVSQAPVMFGLLVASLFAAIASTGLESSFGALSPLWSTLGSTKALLLAVVALSAAALAVGGAWLGVRASGTRLTAYNRPG